MTAAAATPVAPAEDLALTVQRLREDLDDAIEERDRLQQEVNQYEVDWDRRVEVNGDQRGALAHARTVLEAREAPDPFTQIMDVRAVGAITELLGDR